MNKPDQQCLLGKQADDKGAFVLPAAALTFDNRRLVTLITCERSHMVEIIQSVDRCGPLRCGGAAAGSPERFLQQRENLQGSSM